MSQFDPPPIGDVLEKAVAGEDSGSGTPPCVNTLPTQTDILVELKGGQDVQTGNRANLSTDAVTPNFSQAEPSFDTEEVVGETTCKDFEECLPMSTSPDSEKTSAVPSPATPLVDLAAIQTRIDGVEQNVRVLADSSVRITCEVREMHKLYHNEYASRLKSMQDELERYREIDKGRVFDGILGEVAKLYCDLESVLNDIADEKVKKRIRYMLEDIVQILEANGVFKQKSNLGDKRNTRHCQVIERIPTSNPEQNDMVAKSRGTGFYIENRSLIKEPVDIYLFVENAEDKPAQTQI